MNAYCPECETDLDQSTGICPACRWDPTVIARAAYAPRPEPEMSLTERYRGTVYDVSMSHAAAERRTTVSKGRAFVVVSLVAGAGLYAAVVGVMGPAF